LVDFNTILVRFL